MSMSDDPRGFRRGQGGGRDYGPPQQGQGGRGAPPANDRYDAYRDQDPPASRGPQNRDKPQPAFSAYRPEAYANSEAASPGLSERPEWDKAAPRAAPQPTPAAPPSRQAPQSAPQQNDPYARAAASSRDPYYQDAPSDPYASRSPGGYDRDWENETYRHSGAHQFPSYYPPSEDAALGPDAQSLHDRFFSSEPGAGDPLPAPPQGRYQNAFEDHDYGDAAGQGFDREDAAPYADEAAAQAPRREPNPHDPAFDEGQFQWDQYDQAPPPSSARPFHPPTIVDEDMDADFFADEDDFDADDYEPERKGGRKKLMAAVLVGAVVVGGGLAYVYKFSSGDGTGGPSLISADNSPIKEQPSEPGGRDFPNGNKLIYDRLGGEEETTATRLAGGESTAAPQSGEATASSSGTEPIPGIVTTGGTLEERIENALKAQGNSGQQAADTADESADAPRTVKTVTFGPDGNPQPAEQRTQRIAANDRANENFSSGVVITTAQTVSAANEASAGQADRAAQPEETQVASVSPQPQTVEVTESSGGTGAYFVQVGARNDREAAIAAFATLQQKYSSLIGNYAPSVRKADLGAKGVWYRLLVGPVENKTDADALCEQLKGAGMRGCFSRKD